MHSALLLVSLFGSIIARRHSYKIGDQLDVFVDIRTIFYDINVENPSGIRHQLANIYFMSDLKDIDGKMIKVYGANEKFEKRYFTEMENGDLIPLFQCETIDNRPLHCYNVFGEKTDHSGHVIERTKSMHPDLHNYLDRKYSEAIKMETKEWDLSLKPGDYPLDAERDAWPLWSIRPILNEIFGNDEDFHRSLYTTNALGQRVPQFSCKVKKRIVCQNVFNEETNSLGEIIEDIIEEVEEPSASEFIKLHSDVRPRRFLGVPSIEPESVPRNSPL